MNPLINIFTRLMISLLYLLLSSISSSSSSNEFLVKFLIADNNPRHFIIGNIISQLKPKFPSGTYQIVTRKCSYSKFNQFFRLSDTGSLSLAHSFDRDDINNVCGPLGCCDKPICEINLDIVVTVVETREKRAVKVLITIADENDNPPRFLEKSFPITIVENADTSLTYHLPYALDDDSLKFGIKTYRLSGKHKEYFQLLSIESKPALKCNKSFDYENPLQRQFNLYLVALDKGDKAATLDLTITVADMNDNAPKFQDNTVNLTILENTTFPNAIHKFQAIDPDSGNNGKITYSFSPTTLPNIREKFDLNPNSGELFLKQQLDYELYSEKYFKFGVKASDHGSPQQADFCEVEITVLDINDNSPVIDIVYARNIPENEPIKDPVLKIYVRDEDSVDNDVTCKSDEVFNQLRLVQVEKYSYFIYASGMFDYEKENNISLTLICQDSAKNPRSTNHQLYIQIEDKNDNYPTFERQFYFISIAENFPISELFLSVKATDLDSNEFGSITYRLDEVFSSNFKINARSGGIELNKQLDRENIDYFNISILAIDGGGLQSNAYVQLTVLDVNDNAPSLISNPNMSISENCPLSSIIGYLQFTDPDLGENSTIEWNYELLGNSSMAFRVSNRTILTFGNVDREKMERYYILIKMHDMGTPSMTSSVTVTISIIDENDNIPQIIYPETGSLIESSDSVILAVNTPKFTTILVIKSYDPDFALNGEVRYHVLPSNGSRFFIINQTTGEVQTNWNYDSLSFTPSYPKEDVYKIAFAAYNQIKSYWNKSSSTTSHFFIRIGQYRHMMNNEIFYKQHKRPFFNNVILLILIAGFTIALSAALIAAIIWAKSRFSSESNSLQQVQASDGKFMMMMMSGDQQNTNNTYVYDPYYSMIGESERTIDSGYPLSQSRSSTFNNRHNKADYCHLNNFETKTLPRSVLQTDLMHHYPNDIDVQPNSLSTNNLASSSNSSSVRHHKTINSFYRHFEHDPQCVSPMIKPVNRIRSIDRQYGNGSSRGASICDPTPNLDSQSHWIRQEGPAEDGANSFTIC